jgi:hypothetical protein
MTTTTAAALLAAATARKAPLQPSPLQGIDVDDFYSYLPAHSYLYRPTRELWPASSVNAKIPPIALTDAQGKPVLDDKGKPKIMTAAAWLDANRSVEQMTWAPGEPELIKDRHVADGGWIERKGATTFNLYRPPTLVHGRGGLSKLWHEHIRRVYPDDADHIARWLAYRVQHPEVKINHALVLGGAQGIGKDTLLEPIKYAVGPWNFSEISPQQLLGRFNGFVKSVILRVSEARDLGDIDRYALYEHMKVLAAAPPDVLRCDEKHLREHAVLNCAGVIVTTNHKLDGIYVPADDRRHYVAWSDLTKDDFEADYWNELYAWYAAGGIGHVAAYLANLDLSGFDPKAPPKKTEAWWAIVNANHAPEDSELADILDRLGNPKAATLLNIADHADYDFGVWLRERRNRRIVGYRLESCGYVAVRNEGAKDGLWVINQKRQAIYAKTGFTTRERCLAAARLAEPPHVLEKDPPDEQDQRRPADR